MLRKRNQEHYQVFNQNDVVYRRWLSIEFPPKVEGGGFKNNT